MLTTAQKNKQKNKLLKRKEEIQDQLPGGTNETEPSARPEGTGELSNNSNHPGDEATEMFEREKDIAFNNNSRQQLEDVEEALKAMEEGTYGRCEVCGEVIPIERLEIVPETRRCVKHADKEKPLNNRAVEEDVIQSSVIDNKEEIIFDREDAWETASDHGTSQSPSDNLEAAGYNNAKGNSKAPKDTPVADLEGYDTGQTSDQKEYGEGNRNSFDRQTSED
ncbi:TraR/DksA C4-type zinc finger protein [Alteribacillus bidgolensis]|uniref:Transcriptional regulator, TraR/DksA family n=1 Tax=Alteribacillus bidgolensis TaxID=930129 RepID=A0A1G8QID5_9BACI|nr:TraR/DksA C4-type zinc finger protein [Alteribacillus bidgolensis]SDJ04155.1 transcriptional regulator, TraR/DksA family [Alteribacillus bidgolensis]